VCDHDADLVAERTHPDGVDRDRGGWTPFALSSTGVVPGTG
jgi:hypothetical protein